MDDLHREQLPADDERGGENHWSLVEQRDVGEIEYDTETETYHASYDRTTESVCMVVISVVASITNSDPRDLEPIYPIVDPDALDSLFSPSRDGTPRIGGQVQFTYCGHQITVTSEGKVRAIPITE